MTSALPSAMPFCTNFYALGTKAWGNSKANPLPSFFAICYLRRTPKRMEVPLLQFSFPTQKMSNSPPLSSWVYLCQSLFYKILFFYSEDGVDDCSIVFLHDFYIWQSWLALITHLATMLKHKHRLVGTSKKPNFIIYIWCICSSKWEFFWNVI